MSHHCSYFPTYLAYTVKASIECLLTVADSVKTNGVASPVSNILEYLDDQEEEEEGEDRDNGDDLSFLLSLQSSIQTFRSTYAIISLTRPKVVTIDGDSLEHC